MKPTAKKPKASPFVRRRVGPPGSLAPKNKVDRAEWRRRVKALAKEPFTEADLDGFTT